MATTNAEINVSVNGLSSLDTLDKKLSGIGATFAGLKTKLAIATIGLAAFGRSAITMADDLNDLSAATGIGIGRLIEYKNALVQAGGQADTMAAGIVKFTQSIDEAAQGTLKTQNAFADLGISLQDLKTLSEEDLLTRALEGFDKITDKSREASLKMDLFGKSFKTVDPREMSDKLREAAGSGDKYAQSIKQAADLNDKMAKSANDMRIAFLQVTAPLVNMINYISENGQNIERLVTIMKVLGTVLLAVFGGGIAMAVVRFFGMIARGFAAIGPAIAAVSEYFASFGAIAEAGAARATLSFAANGKLMTALRGVAAFAGSVGGAVLGVLGLGGASDATKPAEGGKTGDAAAKESSAAREVTDALAKKRLEIENITKAFKMQNSQLIDNINIEKMLVGKSQEEADIIKAQEEVYKRTADEVEKLRDAKALLSKDEAGLIPIYDAQIKKIQENGNATAIQVKNSLQGLQGLKLLEQDRINNIQRITDALEKQKKLDESILQIRQSTQGQLDQAGFEKAQMGRNPLEKQFAQIQESARKAALEAGRAFSEQFNQEDMGAADAQKLADGLDLIAQKYKNIADAQSANLAISRTWEQGWADAFNSYMDNATNAAQRAGEVFGSVTQNMNSAIDKFVETGKFSFGDFAKSIIQDLLKIELKAQATALFKQAAGGLGGLLGGIGSIFGGLFADGGNPPVNKPSIVGERGPELFVPKTAGTIIPNGQGMGSTVNNYITNNNISAVDGASVARLFADNRKSLLGATQLAQKELPYGNR
jgi:lambda family phage tail tape measure protein